VRPGNREFFKKNERRLEFSALVRVYGAEEPRRIVPYNIPVYGNASNLSVRRRVRV